MPGYLLLLVAITVGIWLLLLVQSRPMTIATGAFLVAFFAQSTLGLSNDIVSRIPIALLLGLALLFAMGERQRGANEGGNLASVQAITTGIIFLLGASLYSSIDIPLTIQATAAAAGVFFVGITLGRYVPVATLLDRLALASVAVCAASVVAIAFSADAYLGDRLSGIFRNPNAMGAAVLMAMISVPRRWLVWATPPLAVLLVMTGSRASGLAFLVVLVLRIDWRPSTRLGAMVVFPLVATLFLLLGASAFSEDVETGQDVTAFGDDDASLGAEVSIFRTRDNRSSQWEQGWTDFRDNLPLGTGFGTASSEYSNSGLFLLVETGALAVPIALLGFTLAARAARHPDKRVRALAGGFLVHSLFEGWMFSFGSFQAVIFWMVLTAALAERLSTTRQVDPTGTASPLVAA